MSAMSFLLAEEWNKSDGELDDDNEITVNGEFYIGEQQRPKIVWTHTGQFLRPILLVIYIK